MTMPRVEVITSVERRRRWSRDEKERLVAASFELPHAVAPRARMPTVRTDANFLLRRKTPP